MGNNNSGHAALAPAPPLWTQSLPRDAHRNKKQAAIQGPKVLPERIPGQRLKPTENGRNLQIQGTISPRKVNEVAYSPPGYPPPPSINHHSSMNALNHPSAISPSSFYPSNNDPSPSSRFGPAHKSFTSEPDLRGVSPTSHVSLPTPTNTPHTLICESPTKGKIKSKKRYKAPPPPSPLQASLSFPLERSDYVPSPCMSFENRSSVSSPTSKSSKSKPRKIGLFKKRNESRMSNYEIDSEHRVEGRGREKERSTTPVPIQISSKKELKERARSLDNLQHEIRRSPQGLTSSLHSLEVIGNSENDGRWEKLNNENYPTYNVSDRKNNVENEQQIANIDEQESPASATLDRQSRNHRRLSSVERKLYERQLAERRSEGMLSSPVGDPKRFDNIDGKTTDQRRSYSSCSSYVDNSPRVEKDEWDLAEEEWLNNKKKSENLQREIVHVVKNLRKTSVSPEPTFRPLLERKDISVTSTPHRESGEGQFDADETPKTFFFGMKPDDNLRENVLVTPAKTALAKLNEQEEVKINGTSVEYSRHSLKPKEKRRSIERDNWNRSLDYRDKTRSRSKDNGLDDVPPNRSKKISREIDEFAATIERQKLKQLPSDELSNSISRKGDGGYHSRQNSGSFHLENEGSDDDNVIRMNLRPTLPRRQLELPRFSPNAAWRSLSVETSGRQKEGHNDIAVNDDVFTINEDQIHRYTRPTAPPRTSGEKSADSGISGDAGSPGPLQEFEPLTADKVKSASGPLAASSPVPSAKLETKRAWTPAQDLDDNSFEEHNEHNIKGPQRQEITSMPKLTSRTNMFSKSADEEYKRYGSRDMPYTEELHSPVKYKEEEFSPDVQSLQRIKRAASSNKATDVDKIIDASNDDHWRENWSMSRSIPNSLNAFDEPDCITNSHIPSRSKSESRVSQNQSSENRAYSSPSKVITPGYLQHGNSGHIMYLPEYKAYQVSKELERRDRESMKHSSNNSKGSSTPDQERKSPSGDENPGDPESSHWNAERMRDQGMDSDMSKGRRIVMMNGKKSKKFSYQSTVRMMEKKKLEVKLSKEVEEKERRRLQEVEAMMKVEQEFQQKREREKKRLKKQLMLFQEEESNPVTIFRKASPELFTVPESPTKDTLLVSSAEQPRVRKYDDASRDTESRHLTPPLPSSPPPFSGHRQMSSYQSLPMDHVNNGYPSTVIQQNNQSGLLSGFKKWVKGKKESRSGYMSDASSVTVNSGSPRQEPDGAPAPSPSRKNVDNIRAEIIAASRHRNGTSIEREIGQGRYSSGSPAPSAMSKESQRRTVTPDSKRTISPDSRRSASSEACRLTQELPEMRQELRQYREYRRSNRKAIMPYMGIGPLGGHIKSSHKESHVNHNYRRDFCLGNVPQMRLYHPHDDLDLYSRHSNESRKSKHSKRSSSTEHEGGGGQMSSLRRQYSSNAPPKHAVPISIPPHQDPRSAGHGGFRIIGAHIHKGYPPPHIAPYNPNKGYRPVSFSPTQGKILSVT